MPNGVVAPVPDDHVSLNANEPAATPEFLTITMVPRWVLVNVHVTVSSAATEVAVIGEPSLHVADDRSQPAGMLVSATEQVPGAMKPLSPDWPSDNVRSVPTPLQLPSNVNCCGEPSGSACFVTTILPSLVLLNVHVTV